jgi:hypothetical protein
VFVCLCVYKLRVVVGVGVYCYYSKHHATVCIFWWTECDISREAANDSWGSERAEVVGAQAFALHCASFISPT